MENEIMFTIGENGELTKYEEPYGSIECETEEDYNKLLELLEKGKTVEKNSNLKKAIFTLLYDQYDIPDIELDCSDSTYVDYIIESLIEKNGNRCPFKCYDCIGKCKTNTVGCAEGSAIDCNREVEEIWKDFIV